MVTDQAAAAPEAEVNVALFVVFVLSLTANCMA
jgi:hypothetical protein